MTTSIKPLRRQRHRYGLGYVSGADYEQGAKVPQIRRWVTSIRLRHERGVGAKAQGNVEVERVGFHEYLEVKALGYAPEKAAQ